MRKVSCLCPTSNRPPGNQHLLEEAVESFLRQDYPDKELIVLNDTPGQELRFEHPEVRIINEDARYPNLGAKRNRLAELASGDLLCPWDDDDISLPWRLSRSVELLGDADYYNPGAYWFLHKEELRHDHAPGWTVFASIYQKKAYMEVGGTPDVSLGEDYYIDARLRGEAQVAERGPLAVADWFYIYRWGVSAFHLSYVRNDSFWDELGRLPIVAGVFDLQPHWQVDYAALTRAYAFALSCTSAE